MRRPVPCRAGRSRASAADRSSPAAELAGRQHLVDRRRSASANDASAAGRRQHEPVPGHRRRSARSAGTPVSRSPSPRAAARTAAGGAPVIGHGASDAGALDQGGGRVAVEVGQRRPPGHPTVGAPRPRAGPRRRSRRPWPRRRAAAGRSTSTGVSSSKTTTASTHSSASSTRARSAAVTSGRDGPLSRRTDVVGVEAARPGSRRAARAARSVATCPACSRSKQPPGRHDRAAARAHPARAAPSTPGRPPRSRLGRLDVASAAGPPAATNAGRPPPPRPPPRRSPPRRPGPSARRGGERVAGAAGVAGRRPARPARPSARPSP